MIKKKVRRNMKTEKFTKKLTTKLIETIAIKVAISDANAACPCVTYQPKMPKAVKKLRKF